MASAKSRQAATPAGTRPAPPGPPGSVAERDPRTAILSVRDEVAKVVVGQDDVVEQVRVTVVHEVAHHFGIDDDRLTELGWA